MTEFRAEAAARLAAFDLPAADAPRMIEELALHLEARYAELRRDGQDDVSARRQVLDEITDDELRQGGWLSLPIRTVAAPVPTAHSSAPADALLRDLQYAVRSLRRQPGFMIAAVLALALGIGATTAVVGTLDAVLLRPMPFPHADRLFVPAGQNLSRGITRSSVCFADAEDWRQEPGLFEALALWQGGNADLTGLGDPERVQIALVDRHFFRVVDVVPLLGRNLLPPDHDPDAPDVIVISHALWQRRFGGAADVVGRHVTVGGEPREIVGVLPARRVWPSEAALFIPMNTASLGPDVTEKRDNMMFNALARLPDGVSAEAAATRLAAIAARVERDHPKIRTGWTITLVPLRDYIVDTNVSLALYTLLTAVGGVLLIACANVANLALVRGSSRARELAIRLSLGASRTRLVQQLLVESAVLVVLSTALGIALAVAGMRALVAMAPPGTPFLDDVRLDGRVLSVAIAAGALAMTIAGVIPAVLAASTRATTALRDGSAGAGASRRGSRVRSSLVIAEIAAAVVLVSGSALLIRSFARLTRVDPGVTLDRVASGRISIPASRYDTEARRLQFSEALVARLAASPDVERAALTSFVPAGGGGFGLGRMFVAEGRSTGPDGSGELLALWNVVTPGYFSTLGITLPGGRDFDTRDGAGGRPVMIVSKLFAQRMFPGESPIGKRVKSSRDENVYREVVGVAEEVRYWGLAERQPAPLVYVPWAQDVPFGGSIVARSRGARADAILPSIRAALLAVDPQMAIADLRTLEASAARSIVTERYSTLLLSVLAGAALLLSGLGVYAVSSHVFAMRRREMGIRLALGSSRSRLYRLVLTHALRLAAIGLALGAGIAAIGTRWLESLLFGTSPADSAAWGAMAAVVLLSTLLACAVPAWRTASTDPVSALRD
ncbi:MAG TPA: ABC transporter permease [Vicinamibacterales bacterium]|nr:ABC transporter permease [Vicinamibacterales bacterium]